MARRVEERVAAIDALRDAPLSADDLALLRRELKNKTALVVAACARVIGAQARDDLFEPLSEAFHRFLDGPDPQCLAKRAIAEALSANEAAATDVYVAGLHHVQLEPVWGGRVDTAGTLRASCAFGLVRMGHPDTPLHLARLLADPERVAREAAARGLGAHGAIMASVPLLRFKALLGDDDPGVTREVLLSLLALAPDEIELAAELAAGDDPDAADAALLAIGEARHERSFELLRAHAEAQVLAERRAPAYVAMALLREDRAVDHLLGLVAGASLPDAEAALQAVSSLRYAADVRRRIAEAVDRRGDGALAALHARLIPDG